MNGNLNENYQLRQDRIRRISEAFKNGRITAYQHARLMEQEGFGFVDDTKFRLLGNIVHDVMVRIDPNG